jgi:hypothetical protein
MTYNIFLFLHIFFAGMVLSLFPFSMFMKGRKARSKGTPVELYHIQMEFGVGRFMGMIGGIGLLIAGGAMAGIGKMPWFDFGNETYLWLAVKQVIYVFVLILNFGFMMPVAKKAMPLVAQQLATGGTSGATEEIRALAAKASVIGALMGILGLVNAILGVFGPSWRMQF